MKKRNVFILFAFILSIFFINNVFAGVWESPQGIVDGADSLHPSCGVCGVPLPKLAHDNDIYSGWDSANSPFPHWIWFDLGQEKKISNIRLYQVNGWSITCTDQYLNVDVSHDGVNWVTVLWQWRPSYGCNQWQYPASFTPVNARYIRLYFTSATTTGNTVSLVMEFQAFVDPACVPQCAGKNCGPDSCGGSCGDCNSKGSGLVCSSSQTCIYPSTHSLILYYPFNGNMLNYASGFYPGTCNPTSCPISSIGKINGAYDFDGTDHVDVPTYVNGLGKFTFSSWVYQRPNIDWGTILSKGNFWNDYWLSIKNWESIPGTDKGKVEFRFNSQKFIALSNGKIPDNTWTHVAVTYDGSNVKFYLNCILDKTVPYSDNLAYTFSPLYFATTPTGYPLKGQLDEIKVWDYALTPAELANECGGCSPQCAGKECGDDSCGGSCGACFGSCTSGKCENELYFKDMNGTKINHADLNDRVKLFFEGSDISGKDVTFNIYKQSGTNWPFPDQIIHVSSGTNTFTTSVMSEPGTYYFTVNIDSNTYDSRTHPAVNTYGTLVVSSTPANSPPVTILKNPKNGEIYEKGININFLQESYDVDDFFDYNWEFGDTSTDVTGSSRDFINYNTQHSYGAVGQKLINLSLKDERGSRSEDHVSILIVDTTVNGIYTFANISRPSEGETISSSFNFDATGSYAINITINPTLKIKCLGGACPLHMISSTGNIVIDPDGKKGDYSLLNYSWKFDDGSIYFKNGIVTNIKNFLTVGYQKTNLTVIYNNNINSRIKNFNVGQLNCRNSGTQWFDGVNTYSTLLTNNKCKGFDPISTYDDCCPTSYSCDVNTSDTHLPDKWYACQLNSGIIDYCSTISSFNQYNQANCSVDSCGLCGHFCNENTQFNACGVNTKVKSSSNCNCFWNLANDKCELSNKLTLTVDSLDLDGTCITSLTSTSECIDESMTVEEKSTMNLFDVVSLEDKLGYAHGLGKGEAWINTNCKFDSCLSGTRDVLCGQNSYRLPFFNMFNFVFSLIMIIFIYVIMNIKKTMGHPHLKVWNIL